MKNSIRLTEKSLVCQRTKKQSVLMMVGVVLFLGFNGESYQMIDGVTAASRIATVALPTLTVTATPNIVNNIIQVEAGKPVSITVKASDPNGYNQYVYAGLWQNNTFYTPSLYYTPSGSTKSKSAILPSGAQFKNVGNDTSVVFTWTPQASSQPLTLQFESYNVYNPNPSNYTHTFGQPITIQVVQAQAGHPNFDASVSAQQIVPVGVLSKIPVTVIPDTSSDVVTISSAKLPAGATLSTASKVASGKWVSLLSWTPKLNQLGSNNVTFSATEAQKSGKVDFPVNFVVQDLSTPTFSSTMSSLPKVIVNKKLTYQIILKPDTVTTEVSITPTNLPKGAVLSDPVLVGGQIVATLTWTPTTAQLNTSTQVTFTAEDDIEGSLPVTFKTTFTVTSK